VIRIHANYPNPNGAFSYGKPNSTLPENAIANILTKSVSLLQDTPRDRISVGYLFGVFTRFGVAVSQSPRLVPDRASLARASR
jgi:hypothetical protein